MLKKLWNELGNNVSVLLERLGLKEKTDQAQGAVKDWAGGLHSDYKQSSPKLRGWLWFTIIFTAVVVLYGVIYLAWNTPSIARLFLLPVPVSGYKVQVTKVNQIVGASGTVLEYTDVVVTSRIDADVQNVPVNIGDIITPKTILLEADQGAYLPAAEAAQQEELATRTTVEKDTAMLDGTQQLFKKNLAAQVDVQDAITALATAKQTDAQAQAKVASTTLDLAFTRLKSPLPGNGIVLIRNVNPGDRLLPNTAIFTLGDLDKVYLVAQVQEDMSALVNKTATAEVIFSSFPSQTFQGVVEKIDPTINDKTRTFPVYIGLDNPNLLLKPGVTGFARIKLERIALAVPDAAVMNLYGENASVFVVDENSRAVLTPVRLGLHGRGSYEVLSGVKEGDVVITAGTSYLKENERVHVNFPDKE